MKIAITSLYLPSGSKIGVGYQVHYLANNLMRRGHRVTVFSPCPRSADSLYDVQVVDPPKPLATFKFGWALRDYDFGRFDVLHGSGDDWFLWGCERPRHIHTVQGSCVEEMLHAKTLTIKARMGAIALCQFSSLFLADETVAISNNTRRFMPMIKRVIPCGVGMESFFPGDEKAERPTLLFVGTMHGRKRGRMLLEMFQKQIRPRIPDAEFWAVCEEKVDGPGVRWFGRIPTPELGDLFRRAWVFCLPSTYEGFGVPYIEAMASGTPVVVSPNVGALEVTENGKWGIVAPDDRLAATITDLLQNPDELKRLREAGLRRSRDFTWERVCSQYEALYVGAPEKGTAQAATA